jgi:hypothetical protein
LRLILLRPHVTVCCSGGSVGRASLAECWIRWWLVTVFRAGNCTLRNAKSLTRIRSRCWDGGSDETINLH